MFHIAPKTFVLQREYIWMYISCFDFTFLSEWGQPHFSWLSDGVCKYLLISEFLWQVWVLWTRLCGGELFRDLIGQSPVRSHLLRGRGTEGSWELHEDPAQSGWHSCNANWGSGEMYWVSEGFRRHPQCLLFMTLAHRRGRRPCWKIILTRMTRFTVFPCMTLLEKI